jgi:hypothetical protein
MNIPILALDLAGNYEVGTALLAGVAGALPWASQQWLTNRQSYFALLTVALAHSVTDWPIRAR